MSVNISEIDVEKLREDLKEHFTAAMFMVSPIALVDVSKVENATSEEVIQIALDNKFDLTKYLK